MMVNVVAGYMSYRLSSVATLFPSAVHAKKALLTVGLQPKKHGTMLKTLSDKDRKV